MGNKIRVELSHGGGRTAKYAGDPGACFKCGQLGHWARFEFPSMISAPWAHPLLLQRMSKQHWDVSLSHLFFI